MDTVTIPKVSEYLEAFNMFEDLALVELIESAAN